MPPRASLSRRAEGRSSCHLRGIVDNSARLALVNLRLLDDEPGTGDVPPLAEMLGALEDLRAEGKLEHIGLSNASRAHVEEALTLVRVAGVQNRYSIVDRSSEDVLELCRERELAFVPFFPLGSAFTGGPATLAADPAIASVADKHAVTPSQVALAWLLHRDERILVIPGTSSVAHLEENLAAIDVELDDDDLAALADVTQLGDPLQALHD